MRPPGRTSRRTLIGFSASRRDTRRTIRLLADENVARQKTERLRERGFDVASVAELGLAGQGLPDEAVLALAAAQSRIVLTHNGKDFKRLHRQSAGHAGILVLPVDVRHALIADAAALLLDSTDEWSGRLASLHRPPP